MKRNYKFASMTHAYAAHDEAIKRIAELEAALQNSLRYLDHPETRAIPFALNVDAAIEQARAALTKGE